MIRQTHSYLAGALSGTALIAAAVVAFVLLFSLQALRDWPLAGIDGGSEGPAVSAGRPAKAGAAAGRSARAGRRAGKGARANRTGRGQKGAGGVNGQRGHLVAGTSPPTSAGSPSSGSLGSSPTGGGGSNGSGPNTAPPATSNSGAGGGSGAQSSGGSGSGSGSSTSGTAAGAVNNTVSGVDQAAGGALSGTGVTEVTEEVVNGVAGPESTVGETVDKTTETVGGLLGGSK